MTTPLKNMVGPRGKKCKLCGDETYERTYRFSICSVCELFTYQFLKSKTVHEPCRNGKYCLFSNGDLKECTCCFLNKCAIYNFDPYYATRQEIQRRSIPYNPCPTCTRNTFTARNRSEYSIQCQVCGQGSGLGFHFSALVCEACRHFFRYNAKSRCVHKPCEFYQQCIITEENRRISCTCCRLKKCLAVGMDLFKAVRTDTKVKTNINSIFDIEPKEWFFLLPCETCDTKRISKVNQDIQYLRTFFSLLKEKNSVSSDASNFDNTLIEMNLYPEEPVSLFNDYSGDESGSFGIRGSSQLPTTTVENHHQSFLQVLSSETSNASSAGFPVEANQLENISSTSALSLCPSPALCERISPIDISGETAIEKTDTEYKGIDNRFDPESILSPDLMEFNRLHP